MSKNFTVTLIRVTAFINFQQKFFDPPLLIGSTFIRDIRVILKTGPNSNLLFLMHDIMISTSDIK